MNTVFNNFYIAQRIAEELLESDSVREFLRRHGISRTRTIQIKPDPSQDGYYQIPVFDHGTSRRFVRLFRPVTNAKLELKARLQQLVAAGRGFQPGDVFVSPWARFLVTDVNGLKEI